MCKNTFKVNVRHEKRRKLKHFVVVLKISFPLFHQKNSSPFVIKKIQFYASLLAHASLTSLSSFKYTILMRENILPLRADNEQKKNIFQYSFVTPLMKSFLYFT
jgi:hypothetical protein